MESIKELFLLYTNASEEVKSQVWKILVSQGSDSEVPDSPFEIPCKTQ